MGITIFLKGLGERLFFSGVTKGIKDKPGATGGHFSPLKPSQ